ncbi:FG-GAP-like repeat-containing protein [Pseudoxanthomonas sacheonensis]|uniref:FG-GAP-like repeat-containing protein n=1 Tax=Pseudoxanthomonas sacheonensis TaxID=443615 RepID=UPI0013D1CF87|nr:FG-GAP-like repeat-containing protein [Pseudoxanthomonas sacheonensis]
MPDTSSSRISYSAAALFLLVIAILIAPVGALVTDVLAQSTGGSPPQLLVAADPLSDAVSATAAEFRVDESGAAAYSIPLYAVPGTAGVVPQLTLSYSSQNGDGPVGKGWAIGGLSSISRCRATREAGDFIGASTPDGNPTPINFSASDRFCLDGQRLIPSSATCPAASGMTAAALATEVDSFARVCAYTAGSATGGPSFFTVERKDGSTSWYGDRDNNNASNRPDGYFETNSTLNPAAALTWAQTRFQDSTGNYIDYFYLENPAGAGTGEHLISEVRYTGKTVLSGQSGSAAAPYAKVVFNYVARPAAKWSKGYASGGTFTQSRSLSSITSCATLSCTVQEQVRHYLLTYAVSVSGSNFDTLIGLQECRDNTAAVCASPTSFVWSQGKYEFATQETPANLPLDVSSFAGFKYGDLDGDGRSDLVYLRGGSSNCATNFIVTALSVLDSANRPAFAGGSTLCLPAFITNRGEGAWHLFDYNGDGRDDLFVAGPEWQGWRLFPSNGSGFDSSQNLIAGLSSIIPSYPDKNDQVQLADLNGDGLTDVVYPNGGTLRARIMERQGAGFGWGIEKTIAIDQASLDGCAQQDPGDDCSYAVAGAPTPKTNFAQLTDFNGDATSDLLIQVTTTITQYNYGTPGCPIEPIAPPQAQSTDQPSLAVLPYVIQEDSSTAAAESVAADSCVVTTITNRLHALSVQSLGVNGVALKSYGVVSPGNPETITFADANGDGLSDVFYRATTNSDWVYQLNRGTGFISGGTLTQTDYREQTRFQDINGDGRADALMLTDSGGNKVYAVRYALSTGGYAATTTPILGGNARLCTGSCNEDLYVPIFSDFDADGNLDLMSIRMENNPALYVSRSNSRFEPRDTLVKVVNGLGSETDITYAPLTNKDLYRRDTGSRNGLNWGRGAPVLDLLAPSYAVARVSSSSPQLGAPSAKATLHYRYAGARVQAGGRGFLGFREMITIDPNQSGGHVVTTTTYAQNFPFVGVPTQTIKAAVLNQAYLVPTCLSSAITNACYATPGQGFPSLGGSVFSNGVQIWEVAPASLATQTPLNVRTLGTEESLRDPFTGSQTSKVSTAFTYGSYGNVSQTRVDTFNGTESAAAVTVITANTYTDDVAKWRLGRLTASTITHRRPSQPDVVRTTGFSYSMGGAATGLLSEERTQPGGSADQALTKTYTLDQYGNRVQSVICGAPATSCSTTGFQFHPAALNAVKRYSRVEYDAQGRFPVTTIEPFWNGTGTVELTTSRVVERNIFGDAVNVLDVNNVRTFAVKGLLGRDYYGWAQTSPNATPGNGGMTSLTTYRWCGSQVNCPQGAKVRQQVVTLGSPRQWTYLDVLGRPVMKAVETFNTNVIGKDVAATCTAYDVTGKPIKASNPFFLAGTGGTDGPTGLDAVCTSASRLWTTTTYDLLGRPTRVETPDPNGTAAVTNAYSNLTTGARDPRGNLTNSFRNGKGELTKVVDATGLATYYNYFADGTLGSVLRDAGRGTVGNYFGYDVLGRKTSQQDPDSGLSTFQYNALGEVIVQIDAKGQRTENEYDARGRVWRRTVKTAGGTIETQSTFTFDTATNGAGQLASESITGTYAAWSGQSALALGYTRSATYDAMGRGLTTATTIDGVAYATFTHYDELGRAYRGQDASGRWVKTEYDARGFVRAVCNSIETDTAPTCPADANTYVATLTTDEWGHVTKERRGNSAALEVNRTYYAQNGKVAEICGGTSAGCNLVKEGYGWDLAGNLSTHSKETRYVETFTYDSLNRLRTTYLAQQDGVPVNQLMQNYEYDQLGNICHRDTHGWASRDYTYAGRAGCGLGGANSTQGSGGTGTLGPGQVTALVDATTLNQYYDANGNMIQRDGPVAGNDWVLKYTAANQAHEITKDTGERMRFWYGADGARYKSEDGAKKTLYLGNVEIVTDGAVVTTRRTIAGVMLQTVVGTTATNYYLFHDQLGSLVRIANAAGAVVSSMDFLAFGGRRNTDTQAANGTPPSLTPRGFTGHEMLDSVGLIHMNGRIYDQYLGRFLQPDPVIQTPDNAQSWNAYTYCFNNPLAYTDPSGNISLRQGLALVIGAVAAIFGQYYITQGMYAAAFGVAIAGGFAAGYVGTGTLKGGVQGAFAAGLTMGVGVAFQGANIYAQMFAQGLSGGIVEGMNGGDFGNGFLSAGLTTAFMPQVGFINNDYARTAVGAIVGGSISKATGGKFANGAISGAIQGAMSKTNRAEELNASGNNEFGSYETEAPEGFNLLREKYPEIDARMDSYWDSSFKGNSRREYGFLGVENLEATQMRFLQLEAKWSWNPMSFGYKSIAMDPSTLKGKFFAAGLNPAEWNIRVVYHTHPFDFCNAFCGPGSSGLGPSSGDQSLANNRYWSKSYFVVRQMQGMTAQGIPTYQDLYYGPSAMNPNSK